jgi:hypothetical protein
MHYFIYTQSPEKSQWVYLAMLISIVFLTLYVFFDVLRWVEMKLQCFISLGHVNLYIIQQYHGVST